MKSEVRRGAGRLEISRYFDAPRERVFAWWADGEKMQRWSKCKDAVDCKVTMDFRVGGGFTHWMKIAAPQGECEFTLTGRYEEIVAPERIAYRANFGNFETKVTVAFAAEGPGTRVTLTHEGGPDDFFVKNVSQGTSDSFDALDELMVSAAAV